MTNTYGMQLTILTFGITRDIVGKTELQWESPQGITVQELKQQLQREYPRMEKLASLAIAVNGEYAQDTQTLQASDEIALIPPVSGG